MPNENHTISRQSAGKLYLVATPIGNLGDVSNRVLETLSSVDLVAAEDTRTSALLFSKIGVKNRLISYHEHNEASRRLQILEYLAAGKNVAVVSDAGTPGISDPGEDIVRVAVEHGFTVVSIPGPAAFVNALVASGLSTRRFVFEGFLPNDKKERRAVLESIRVESRTTVLYEAPHRIEKLLTELASVLPLERRIVLARELTKKFEEIVMHTLEQWQEFFTENSPRGEYVIVIEGDANALKQHQAEQAFWKDMTLKEHFEHYIEEGMQRKDAVKAVATDRDMPKRDVYNEVLV